MLSKNAGDVLIGADGATVCPARSRDAIYVDCGGCAGRAPTDGVPKVLGEALPQAVIARVHLLAPHLPLIQRLTC